MKHSFTVYFTRSDGRVMRTACSGNANMAVAVARKRVDEGNTDVRIEVTPANSDESGDSWPPIDVLV